MAGRKKIPTNLKVLQGTYRDDRANKNEPKPELRIPTPPEHLDQVASVEWGRVSSELYQLGLLTGLDRAALAAYCQCYSRWVNAEEKLKSSGLIVKTQSGNIIQSPLVGIANTALKNMHRFLTEFGLTPASRSRVSTKKEIKDKDDWGRFGT